MVESLEPAFADMLIGTCTPSTANNHAGELSSLLAWPNGPGQAPTALIPAPALFPRYPTAVVKDKKTAAPDKKLIAAVLSVLLFAGIANLP